MFGAIFKIHSDFDDDEIARRTERVSMESEKQRHSSASYSSESDGYHSEVFEDVDAGEQSLSEILSSLITAPFVSFYPIFPSSWTCFAILIHSLTAFDPAFCNKLPPFKIVLLFEQRSMHDVAGKCKGSSICTFSSFHISIVITAFYTMCLYVYMYPEWLYECYSSKILLHTTARLWILRVWERNAEGKSPAIYHHWLLHCFTVPYSREVAQVLIHRQRLWNVPGSVLHFPSAPIPKMHPPLQSPVAWHCCGPSLFACHSRRTKVPPSFLHLGETMRRGW